LHPNEAMKTRLALYLPRTLNRDPGFAVRLLGEQVADDGQAGSLVVLDRVVEDFDLIAGHDHDSGSRRNRRHDVALGGEILVVVGLNRVLVDPTDDDIHE
jgi:hypothetical protein